MFKDFGVPARIKKCKNELEIIELVNTYNGIVDVYCSLFWYTIVGKDIFDNDIRESTIDKAFFDFDNDPTSTKKFVEYLISKDISFKINFSGRGHHVYIPLQGKGDMVNLRIFQLAMLAESGVMCDPHVIGDTARISRIVNTWNTKSKSYCIPIKIEEIGKEDATAQRFETFEYGKIIPNLSEYIEEKYEDIKPIQFKDIKINTDIILLPCIRSIVSKANPRHYERYVLAIYLSDALRSGRDICYFDLTELYNNMIIFFKDNCSHWLDFNMDIIKYQLKNIVPKSNVIAGCKFIKKHNCCTGCIKNGV